MYSNFDYDDDCDEVICDCLRDVQVDMGIMSCEAYYGKNSHIRINGGQPQPLDDVLFQPADLLEVFRNVSVTHMTEHIEDAIDIMHDVTIELNAGLNAVEDSVVCGRLKVRFPAIEWDDLLHYLESVE